MLTADHRDADGRASAYGGSGGLQARCAKPIQCDWRSPGNRGTHTDDVDWLVPHQANKRIIHLRLENAGRGKKLS